MVVVSGVLFVIVLVLFVILFYVRNWDGGDGICFKMSCCEIMGFIEKYVK